MHDINPLTERERYWKDNAYADALHRLRHKAAERFDALSWPDQTIEEWRRTNITPYDFGAYRVAREYRADARIPASIADRVRATSASAFGQAEGDAVARLIERRIDDADNRFILWNYMLMHDVRVIEIDNRTAAREPIVIDYHAAGGRVACFPLLIVLAGSECELSVIARFTTDEGDESLCVGDIICSLSAASRVTVTAINAMNLDSFYIGNGCAWLDRDATLYHGSVSLGGLLSKGRFDAYLDGQGAEAYLNGCYIGHEDQHIDLRTLQVHRAPSTNSFALYRGIATGESHTIYQGLIEVEPDAVTTDAYLTNNNLILSDDARSDSIPSLNIKTDEVKCSHGSTTGKIDANQLFYLLSRGLDRHEAIQLIVHGFLAGVIDKLPSEIQDELYATCDTILQA